MNVVQKLKELGAEGLRQAIQRFDSWQNTVTGFGTERDKTVYTTYAGSPVLTDQQLSNIYHGDDLAARMVDIVPDELMREGFNVDFGDPQLNTQFADHLEALGLEEKFADAYRWGRLYGGAALLLGADDGRSAAKPLQAEKADALTYVHVLDRRYLWPNSFYTEPGHPKIGQPETYLVAPTSTYSGDGMAVVHETRLVLFGGATTGIQEREQQNWWDLSVLQRAFEALRSFNTGFKAAEALLTDANQAVFKMQGLAEAIGADGEDALRSRLRVMDMYRSVMRALVIDAGGQDGTGAEDFSRQSVSFTDIPAMLDRLQLRLAASVKIPVTLLMGQSPAGMNATGESDFRGFYGQLASEQTRRCSPRLRRIIKVALVSRQFNAKPEKVAIMWPPLWAEAPSAKATTRKALIEGDSLMIQSGIALPEEVALARLRGEGFVSEITLTEEGIAARKSALQDELERLEEGTPDPAVAPVEGAPNPADAAQGGQKPPAPTPDEADEQRIAAKTKAIAEEDEDV